MSLAPLEVSASGEDLDPFYLAMIPSHSADVPYFLRSLHEAGSSYRNLLAASLLDALRSNLPLDSWAAFLSAGLHTVYVDTLTSEDVYRNPRHVRCILLYVLAER